MLTFPIYVLTYIFYYQFTMHAIKCMLRAIPRVIISGTNANFQRFWYDRQFTSFHSRIFFNVLTTILQKIVPDTPLGPMSPISPFSPVWPGNPWSPFLPSGPLGPGAPSLHWHPLLNCLLATLWGMPPFLYD